MFTNYSDANGNVVQALFLIDSKRLVGCIANTLGVCKDRILYEQYNGSRNMVGRLTIKLPEYHTALVTDMDGSDYLIAGERPSLMRKFDFEAKYQPTSIKIDKHQHYYSFIVDNGGDVSDINKKLYIGIWGHTAGMKIESDPTDAKSKLLIEMARAAFQLGCSKYVNVNSTIMEDEAFAAGLFVSSSPYMYHDTLPKVRS